jgi:branched-chain amino acid transport system substrate-binding protein
MKFCNNMPVNRGARLVRVLTSAVALTLLLFASVSGAFEKGVSADSVRIGGVMDLQGRSRGLGQGMKLGIEAGLRGATIQGRKIEYRALNDSYTPQKTVSATRTLLQGGVFAVLGNVGTPTAKVALPVLAEDATPALGFFTGAGLLRPGVGDVVNFRASYVQETAAVIQSALASGVSPSGICAYVQNDAYGMAGAEGVRRALAVAPGMDPQTIKRIEQILAMDGDAPPRNGLGPIGVYKRNTFVSKPGYQSLKDWEKANGAPCQVVVGWERMQRCRASLLMRATRVRSGLSAPCRSPAPTTFAPRLLIAGSTLASS